MPGPSGQELAVAIVRFVADDSQFVATRQQVLANSQTLAASVQTDAQRVGTSVTQSAEQTASAMGKFTTQDFNAAMAASLANMRAMAPALKDTVPPIEAIKPAVQEATDWLGLFGTRARQVFEIFAGVSLARIFEESVVALRNFVTESAKLGLEAQVVEDAYRRLAGSVGVSSEALVQGMQAASGGILNESDVMQAAARALRQGLNPDQIIALMEVARQQSKITGTEVVTAFNAITEAIANQQLRGLKQQGIIIDVQHATEDYARTLGIAANELNEYGRTQAIATAVIESARGGLAALTSTGLTHSEQVQQMSARWKQFKEDVGKALVDAGFDALGWARNVEASFTSTSSGLGELRTIWKGSFDAMVLAITPVARVLAADLVMALQSTGAIAATVGVGLAAAFSVAVGPLTFLGSILDDIAQHRMPSLSRAQLEANVATADARVGLANAVEAYQRLIGGTTQASHAQEALAASTELGTNKLTAATNQIHENAKQRAEDAAKDIEALSRIDAVRDKAALSGVQFAAQISEANFKAAEADARFYRDSVAGLDQYQARRRQAIVETGTLEAQAAERGYQQERSAQLRRIEGLVGSERQQAMRTLELLDANYALTVQQNSDKTRAKLVEDDTRRVAEIRANDLRMYQDKAAVNDQLIKLGQLSARTQIEWLLEQSRNERLDIETRRAAFVSASQQRIALSQEEFSLLRASGQATVADEVNFTAQRVRAYEAGSQQRLASEKDFITQVKSLQDQLATAGERLWKEAVASLKTQGIEAGNYETVTREILRLQEQSILVQRQMATAGGAVFEQVEKAAQFSRAFAEATQLGVNPAQAVSGFVNQIGNNLRSTLPTTEDLVRQLGLIGIQLPDAASAVRAISQDSVNWSKAFDTVPGALGNIEATTRTAAGLTREQADAIRQAVAESQGLAPTAESVSEQLGEMTEKSTTFGEAMTKAAAGTGGAMVAGLADGLAASLTAIDGFYDALDARITAGNSRIADNIYEGFITRVKDALDAEAVRT